MSKEQQNKLAETAVASARTWWVLSSVCWFVFYRHSPGLISAPAAFFIIGGLFGAGAVFGGCEYWLYMKLINWCEQAHPEPSVTFVRFLSYIIRAGGIHNPNRHL